MFDETCLERGAHVRLLVLEPTRDQLAAGFSEPILNEWTTRAYRLVEHPGTEVWYHKEELAMRLIQHISKGDKTIGF